MLPVVNRSGLSRPADRSAGLQPLAEEEPEESEGNSAGSGNPEEAAEAESERSVQPEQQQVAAGMLMTEHANADSRNPPSVESSHAPETSSDMRDGQGCSSLRDSLDDQQCGKQALPPTVSLMEPCAVSEPTAADSRDEPIVGPQMDGLVQPEHPSEPTSVESEDQLNAGAERAGIEPKISAPSTAAGSEDPAELAVSDDYGVEEPEQADSEAQHATESALGAESASAALGQPGEQGASPEPVLAVAACGAELRPAAAAQGAGPGPLIEGCAAVEGCSLDIDLTASPGQHSAELLHAVTPGTEQAQRQPASTFPTRLLDDFAMIITPVRQLTELAAKQQGPARAPQAPDPAGEHQQRLEDALSEPDDSPELASPVPADRQPDSDTEADQGLPHGHKLASVIRFATPVAGRAAVGAVTPAANRPASASEHQRWEVRALTVSKASTALLKMSLMFL